MARVTVEDCIEIVPNRFELVTLAAARTRQIASGSPLSIERDNDKDGVVALREIAEKTVSVDVLKEEVIVSHQKYGKVDKIDDSTPQIGTTEIASGAKEELDSMMSAAEDDLDLGMDDDSDDDGLAFGDDDIVDVED